MDLSCFEMYANTGLPLVGATVSLYAASLTHPNPGSVITQVQTNPSGFWQFTGLTSGLYDVQVQMPGETKYKWYKGYTQVNLQNIAVNGIIEAPVDNLDSPLINGGFNVWQDGTTFTAAADGKWTADNWIYTKAGAVVHDILRSTDVPAVSATARRQNYSLHLDVTTADAAVAAGDLCAISTRIEGYYFAPWDQRYWTLPFWVKGSKTGRHYVAMRNSSGDRAVVLPYDIIAADTWEYKSVIVPPNPSAGTWNFTNGRGLQIDWVLMAGTNFQGTAGAWAAANIYAASDQVNECDSTANNFRIAMVGPMMPGSIGGVIPFSTQEWNPDDPHGRCRRYNEVMGGSANSVFGAGICVSATLCDLLVPMTLKRANAPTLGTLSGTIGDLSIIDTAAVNALTAIGSLSGSNNWLYVRATTAGGMTALRPGQLYAAGTGKLQIQSRIP